MMPFSPAINLYTLQAITTNEIRIKEDTFSNASKEPASSVRPNKSKLFNMESAAMVKESQEAFKAKARKKSTYFSSRDAEHVRPLFESTWCVQLRAVLWLADVGR